jgi:hypothetical protein
MYNLLRIDFKMAKKIILSIRNNSGIAYHLESLPMMNITTENTRNIVRNIKAILQMYNILFLYLY